MKAALLLTLLVACWSDTAPTPCSDCASADVRCSPDEHGDVRCACSDGEACAMNATSERLAAKCEALTCDWQWCDEDRICVCRELAECPSHEPLPCADACAPDEGVHCDPNGPDSVRCFCGAETPDVDRECVL